MIISPLSAFSEDFYAAVLKFAGVIMGFRLSKIYTKTGDAGQTGLGNGDRTVKCDLRVQAMGEVDELNANIGLLMSSNLPSDILASLVRIQHQLFDLGGELCIPGSARVHVEQIAEIEALIDKYNANLPNLADFILPGGCQGACLAHIARTVCRRAERSVVALAQTESVNTPVLQYLNRLSDWLFVLARVLNQKAGQADILWEKTAG